MPDEFEVPETPEASEHRKERVVGLIIAAIAVVLAIVTHLGNETNDDKILAHVDASDQFSFYQAKKDRQTQLQLQIDNLRVESDKTSPQAQAEISQLITGYGTEIKHLEGEARRLKELLKKETGVAISDRELDELSTQNGPLLRQASDLQVTQRQRL